MRVIAEESLPLGTFLILEMEHHLVALQTANLEAVGDKFTIGLQHYGSVPKRADSDSEQVLDQMRQLGWLAVPQPVAAAPVSDAPVIHEPVPVETKPADATSDALLLADRIPQNPAPAPPAAPALTSPQVVPVELTPLRPVRSALVAAETVAKEHPAEVAEVESAPAAVTATESIPEAVAQVESIPEQAPASPPMQAILAEIANNRSVQAVPAPRRKLPRWMLVAAALLLAVAGVVIFRIQSDARASTQAKVVRPAAVTQPPAVTQQKGVEEPPAPAPTPEPPAPIATAPAPMASPPVPVATAPAPVQAAPSVVNGHTILVTAREPSWLGVNVDGKVVFGKMLAKGDTKQLEFSRFAFLHIGNSEKVDVALDSRLVGPFPKDGSLRLLELTASGARVLPWRNGDPPSPARSTGRGSTP
jgi:hypothetical protein